MLYIRAGAAHYVERVLVDTQCHRLFVVLVGTGSCCHCFLAHRVYGSGAFARQASWTTCPTISLAAYPTLLDPSKGIPGFRALEDFEAVNTHRDIYIYTHTCMVTQPCSQMFVVP